MSDQAASASAALDSAALLSPAIASKKRKLETAAADAASDAAEAAPEQDAFNGTATDASEAKKPRSDAHGMEDVSVAPAPAAEALESKGNGSGEEEDDEDMDARPSFGLGATAAASSAASSSSASPPVLPPASSSSSGALSLTSGIGARLLALAGYSGSGGLGKRGTGRVEPVKASTQVAQEGLGYDAPIKRREHEFEAFAVEVELKPKWLVSAKSAATASSSSSSSSSASAAATSSPPVIPIPSAEEMTSWMQDGPRDPTVLSDARYCSLDVQDALLAAKSAFDGIPSMTFRSARERSNPFEFIRSEYFQNRAALKMAEMDAMCGRIFTQPPTTRMPPPGMPAGPGQPPPPRKKRELVQVGDVCAGPGGFSEFMLTVLKWRAAVSGFTLRSSNDFNVTKFNRSAPTHTFRAFYGRDGTGDITRSENMRDYREQVMQRTGSRGLHVLMGDGGFSVVGRENQQEYLSRQLVLCQFLVALSTLREGGVFVCKLFDSFLPFTVHLLWILRAHFTHFALIKPNQSRPANSERYVVAHGLKRANPPVVAYLFRVNDRINELKSSWPAEGVVDFAANKSWRDRDREIREAAAAAKAAVKAEGQRFTAASDGPLNPGDAPSPAADGIVKQEENVTVKDEPMPVKPELDAVKSEPMDTSASPSPHAEQSTAASAAAAAAPPSPVVLDVLGLVPEHVLQADQEFVEYVKGCNETFAARQIFTLRRLKQYVEDPGLRPDDQEAVRQDCLRFWGLSQQPPQPPPPLEALLPRAERQKRRDLMQQQQLQERASAESNGYHRTHSTSSAGQQRGRPRERAAADDRSCGSRSTTPTSERSLSPRFRLSDSDNDSDATPRSRSRSRSRSRTPPPVAADAAEAARASSRSPSPPPLPSVSRSYVHYDPAWQARHFDPNYPMNASVSHFWTNPYTRRMIETHIPEDIARSYPLLPLPNEQERARLRLVAEQDPSAPLDPRMEQLELLARHARSWHIYAVPSGGIRHTVWFNQQGMGHIDEQGKPTFWNMQPRLQVPPDTVLDVVWSRGVLYVLDAWSLPSPADLFVYRTRPRLLERFELAELLVEACAEPRLKVVQPVPLLEWRRHGPFQEAVAKAHALDPTFDLFFLRDAPRTPANTSYSWTPADQTTFVQVNQLMQYVASKQVPPPGAPSGHAPAVGRGPPVAAARAPPVAARPAAR